MKEAGLSGLAKTLLQKHVGIKKMNFDNQDDPDAQANARALRREKKAARLAKAEQSATNP